MADTLQCVNWHLRYECPFRKGEAVDDQIAAYEATNKLRQIDDAAVRGDVFGDICLTSTVYFQGNTTPGSGFRISDAVAPAGDLAAARAACRHCPANALPPGKMAGCCGYLLLEPEDTRVESALRDSINTRGFERQFRDNFVATKPLWYGLWISSPLTRPQLELLRAILRPLQPMARDDLPQFLRACELSLTYDIPLKAHLCSPGHTDFGYLTTFPHCPRCKKGHGGRWTEHSPKPTNCTACGHSYVPADTYKSEPFDLGDDLLESWLDPQAYRALCDEWSRRR
jgi:hypothetical protein